jgi:hypothetical protein
MAIKAKSVKILAFLAISWQIVNIFYISKNIFDRALFVLTNKQKITILASVLAEL